jgi:hypothetical protein
MGGGMDLMPKITRADVLRARQAFRAVAEIPEWERIARDTFGDAEVDAPSSTARPAAKIAAIWAKMDPAERSEFHRVLAAQVGETTDTLPVDVGAAAREIVEGAKGRAGAPREVPGLREAVHELVRCWAERGGPVEVGNYHRTGSEWQASPLLVFTSTGVRRAVPFRFRGFTPEARQELAQKEVYAQLRALRKSGLI